jgi:hypothetical protein
MKLGCVCAVCLLLTYEAQAFSTALTDGRQLLGATSASALVDSVTDSRSAAPDVSLAAFDARIIAACALDGVAAQAQATQVSTISSYAFVGEGAASALASASAPNALASANVQSIFSASFCLNDPVAFTFSASLYQSSALNYPWVTVQLLNDDGPVFLFDQPGAFLHAGILQPGIYWLAAQASAIAAAETGERDYSESGYSLNLSLLQQTSAVPDSGATLLLLLVSMLPLCFWHCRARNAC